MVRIVRVSVSKGRTVSANYNSFRCDFTAEAEVGREDTEEVKAELEKIVDGWVEKSMADVTKK